MLKINKDAARLPFLLTLCLNLAVTVCLLLSAGCALAFNKNLWPIWEANNPLSTEKIDHSEWQVFLDQWLITNAENINLVNYPQLSKKHRQQLQNYIDSMAKIDIDAYNRDEQLAYWLNLYNALTVNIIARHYPVASVQDINISPGLFSVGPWGAKLVTVNGTSLSLNDIHNRIIRPIWNDPRTHYAINNGSIGAPNLYRQVFTSASLENQLNDAARNYINSMRGVQIIDDNLVVSKIYEWFEDDFGGSTHDVIRHIRYFANPELQTKLAGMKTIEGYIYNWHLNSTLPKQ